MDREALRNLAATRRNQSVEEEIDDKKGWVCKYCEHIFKSEKVFMNHTCREQQRHEELRSVIGQAAFAYYCLWMKLIKRSEQKIETFADSRYYGQFIRFAEWAKRTRLPDVPAFIKAMVDNGKVQPSLWARDNTYALYLQTYDAIKPPQEQFARSLEEIADLITEFKCEPRDVFKHLGVNTLLDTVHKRRISPWFLAASGAFRTWWGSLEPDDKSKIEETIQIGALMIRITNSKKMQALFVEFSSVTKELGL